MTSGLLEEHVDQTESITKYAYELTSRGSEQVKQYPASDLVVQVVKGLNQESWRALELAATALYLQTEETLDVSAAMERALALKPACRTQRDAAESIIAKISRYRVEAAA